MEKTETKNELVVYLEASGLEADSIKTLKEHFLPFYELAEGWKLKAFELVVTDENDTPKMEEARIARLQLKDIRVRVEKMRKLLKEDSLKKGRVIDMIGNTLKELIEPSEAHLEAQEKFREIKEAERKAKLKTEREDLLRPHVNDVSLFSVADMDELAFQSLLVGQKLAKKEKEKADKKAEADRLKKEKEEKEEAERLKKENELLKKKLEKVETVVKEQKAEERKLKNAPDKDKLIAWAKTIDELELPSYSSNEAGKIIKNTRGLLVKVVKYIKDEAAKINE